MTKTETPPLERKLVAIMAADVVSYSRLMHDDEERTLATLTSHRAIVDELIANGRGEIAGTAGDSVLAQFASVVDCRALRCLHPAGALQGQRTFACRRADAVPHRNQCRDVMVKEGDIFGDGVNVAARLEGIAEPGGICVTRGVRDHLRDRLEYKFEDLDEHSVKNITRPVRVFRVCFDPNGTTELTPSEPVPPTAGVILTNNNTSPVAESIEPLELAFWQSVEASDDPEEYRAYLEKFPEGAFAALAEERLTSPSEQSTSTDRTVELEFWNSIKDTEVPANFEAYLEKYPDGEFRSLAEIRLADFPHASVATDSEGNDSRG